MKSEVTFLVFPQKTHYKVATLHQPEPGGSLHQLRLLELKRLMIIQYAAGPKSSTRMFHQKWLQHLVSSPYLPISHLHTVGDGCKKSRNSPAFVLTIAAAISHNFPLATNDTSSMPEIPGSLVSEPKHWDSRFKSRLGIGIKIQDWKVSESVSESKVRHFKSQNRNRNRNLEVEFSF